MALTSKLTEEISLPHEPGTIITIRKLSGPQIDRAREIRAEKVQEGGFKAIQRLTALGTDVSEALWASRKPTAEQPPEIAEAISEAEAITSETGLELDPLLIYDRDTLLLCGIVAWTYPEPVTPEHILDLDAETCDYVARAIAPQARREADRKNGTPASMRRSTAVE